MGYRSDVFISVKTELEEEFEKVLVKAELKDWFKKVDTEDKDLSYYKGEGLKWYEHYEEYIVVDNWLDDKLDKDESSVHSIAMGENGATFFEKGKYYEVFWVESSILIPSETKEQRFYILDKKYSDLVDELFISKAEQEGSVYSLQGFQNAFNTVDFIDVCLRIK